MAPASAGQVITRREKKEFQVIEELHKENCAEQLNTPFLVVQENAPAVTLQLIEVSGDGVKGQQEQFALLFRGPLETFLEQSLHHIEHGQLGQFDLFLVPVARKPEGFEYEAVFNRFVDGAPSA
jgi:hypothetical protein